jgi:catechol 2,3-dioxygenase-like lactoylglutathione lyase family enzyme
MSAGADRPMNAAMAIDHVQVAMPAGREEDARRFYAGVLGLCEVDKPAPLVSRGGVWFEAGGVGLHLGVEKDFRPAKKAHVAFRIGDLATARARFEAAGLPIREDVAIGILRFFTEDFFGNRVEIVAA